MDDIQLASPRVVVTQISPSPSLECFPVSFAYRVDGVAQEMNETFTLSVDFDIAYLGMDPPMIRKTLRGIIQDSDSKYTVHDEAEKPVNVINRPSS